MTVKNINELLDAAKRVVNYIQTNQKTPTTVRVGDVTVSRASFNRMIAAAIIEINNKSMQNILTTDVKAPSNPQGGLPAGQLQKTDYIDAAKRTKDYIAKNGQMPNYITTPLGNMSPFNFMDMYSRALNYYADNKALPNFIYTNSVNIPPQSPVSVPTELKPYLSATKNCQVNDSTIQNLAKQFKTAKEAFNYIKGRRTYELYYNTRRGAVKTLKEMKGNCCDLSHLLIAILRAMGIPARYKHVLAKFSSSTTGHVIVQASVEGKWKDLDISNINNSYESIVSFKLVQVYNTYKELPF